MFTPARLAAASAYRYEYVVRKGSFPFSITGFNYQVFSTPHNLGYVPYVRGYYTYNNSRFFDLFAGVDSYNIAGNAVQISHVYADNTNFYVGVQANGTNASGTIYYRIYAEVQV